MIGITTLSGCLNDSPKPSPDVPTTASDVNDAENKVFDQVDVTNIQAGEYVYILKTQELHSSQEPVENLIQEEGVTITEREEFTDHFDVTVVKEQIDYLAKDKPHYKFKNVYTIDYATTPPPPGTEPSDTEVSQKALLRRVSAPIQALSTSPQVTLSYFNLKVQKQKMAPPKKVLEHDPCPTGSDCKINVTVINYDVVVTEEGQEPQKNKLEVWISSEVPYFATILKSCITTLVKVDDSRPLVRQCQSVYDYQLNATP
jgi:hypothetical protein